MDLKGGPRGDGVGNPQREATAELRRKGKQGHELALGTRVLRSSRSSLLSRVSRLDRILFLDLDMSARNIGVCAVF